MIDYPEFCHDRRMTGSMVKVLQGLRSFDQGSGVWVSINTVAKKLGITERAVQQNIRKLQDLGVLEVKEQFQGQHQRTNFYLFPTPGWWVSQPSATGVNGSSPDTGIPSPSSLFQEEQESHLPTSSLDLSIEEVLPGEVGGETLGRPLQVAMLPIEGLDSMVERLQPKVGQWNSLVYKVLHDHQNTARLMADFEGHVQARAIREKSKSRKISDSRRKKWEHSARALLADHPLDEVAKAMDWLFNERSGNLPFHVVNQFTGKSDPEERRVTRLSQILDHYREIVEAMAKGSEKVAFESQVTTMSMPKKFYDHGAGSSMEGEIAELVDLFARFRRLSEVKDFDLFGWKKSFRVMMHNQGIPFQEIKTVITALADRKPGLDYGRYSAPYDLHRAGEWTHLKQAVQIAQLREEMQQAGMSESAHESPTQGDDDGPGQGQSERLPSWLLDEDY